MLLYSQNDKIYEEFPKIVCYDYFENSDKYSLTTSFKKFKGGAYTFELDVLINGIPIKPKNETNESIIGCGNEFGAFIEIQPFLLKDGTKKGWVVNGLRSICGNTWSLKTFIIIPINNDIKIVEIDSKAGITFNHINKNLIEIWYYYQEWGGSGTANSFFVPSKKVLSFKDDKVNYEVGDLMNNISFLDKPLKDDYLIPTYAGLFVAGLNTKNAKLIDYAFDNYFIEEAIEYYRVHDLPITKDEIREVVSSIENDKILEKYSHLLKFSGKIDVLK